MSTLRDRMTLIMAPEDLYNQGKCFTKGKIYAVDPVKSEAGLMETAATNNQGERHIIGSWRRKFKIVDNLKGL